MAFRNSPFDQVQLEPLNMEVDRLTSGNDLWDSDADKLEELNNILLERRALIEVSETIESLPRLSIGEDVIHNGTSMGSMSGIISEYDLEVFDSEYAKSMHAFYDQGPSIKMWHETAHLIEHGEPTAMRSLKSLMAENWKVKSSWTLDLQCKCY